MPRAKHAEESVRVEIRISPQLNRYLEDLVALGIHGQNPSEVAKNLVSRGVERLIETQVLALHRS